MTVYEHGTIERNFDEVMKDMEKLKEHTLRQVAKAEDMAGIKRKHNLKSIGLSRVEIDKRSDSSWYRNVLYVRIIMPEEVYENTSKTNPLVKFKDNVGFGRAVFKIAISEHNVENLAEFKKIIDYIYEADKPTHEENIKMVQENEQLLTNIFNILDKAGIYTSYYGYKTSRSSKQTKMYYSFPSEIRKQVQTSYSKDTLESKKKELLSKIDSLWKSEIDKVVAERKKKEEEEKAKKQNRVLALLLSKYDLSLEDDWDELLDAILEKNKYLRLAYYLEKNRGDWTEGCSYAETGLANFPVETELDGKVHEDIHYYIETWEHHMDGRVFRDCEYNYDKLFGIVATQDIDLLGDYEIVKEQVDRY